MVHQHDILHELMHQLFKDVGSRAPQQIPEKANAQWLFEFTSALLYGLLKDEYHQLMQLLYRVDVSEKKYKRAMQQQLSEKHLCEVLALLILDRELMKILTRKALS